MITALAVIAAVILFILFFPVMLVASVVAAATPFTFWSCVGVTFAAWIVIGWLK